MQLLGQHHRLARGEDVRIPLDVLDVHPGQQIRRRLHVTGHRGRDRRHPLGDSQHLGEVRPLRRRQGQVDVAQRLGPAHDPLRQLTAQPHRLDPVGAASRQPPGQPQLLDQPGGQHGLLGDVHGRVTGAVGALGDDGPVQAHLRQLQRVGVRMLVDGQDFGGDAQRRHRGLLGLPQVCFIAPNCPEMKGLERTD